MKITKRQLRGIIKEEKAKMLHEQSAAAAERGLGMYANTALIDQLNSSIIELLQGVAAEAMEDGVDDFEAEEMATDVALLAVGNALSAAGLEFAADVVWRKIGS